VGWKNGITQRRSVTFYPCPRSTKLAASTSHVHCNIGDFFDTFPVPFFYYRFLRPCRDYPEDEKYQPITGKLSNAITGTRVLNISIQMRRAVRDYKYEVNEGRMTEECIQYLTQLQKDWERHRVKLGVVALRKEVLCLIALSYHDSYLTNRLATVTVIVKEVSHLISMNLPVYQDTPLPYPRHPLQTLPLLNIASTCSSRERRRNLHGSRPNLPRCSANCWIQDICFHCFSLQTPAC
jgi:hypothetical protein